MKINRKNQLNSSIHMMMQCHEHMTQCTNQEEIIELLELCQDVAIQVGTLVEEETKEIEICNKIVRQLEEYCNEIFGVSQVICFGQVEVVGKIQTCNQTIMGVQKLLHRLTSEKQIAVFLPYNASMWDALDTVCRAAIKESEWDVYVMPIPYYSLNKAGQVEKSHYEYERFPQDLPLICFEEYSLEEIKPDVIFYHNPYDDYNLVTRVYPEFYSRNLVKITNKLVYIPYYLSTGRTMDHMLQMPGVINAWKVIVQSKAMEEQFLEWFSKEKILLLGSPKLDGLMQEVQNPSQLPREWNEKIKDKMVLFWNTHLTSVMIEPEKFFRMLDYIMGIMERNPLVVILWRPHPLMRETLQSCWNSPILCLQYDQKVIEFQEKANAIYDTTEELHRSMAISHGYIGTERSSVYRMYQYLHRNIFVFPEPFESEEVENVYINSMAATGILWKEKIYQFSSTHNAMYSVGIQTNTANYLSSIPQYEITTKTRFRLEGKINDWLILVSNIQNEVVFYHCITGDYRSVFMEEKDEFISSGASVSVQNNIVYVVYFGRTDYHFEITAEDFCCEKQKLICDNSQRTINKEGNIRYLHTYDHYIYAYEDVTKVLIIYDVFTKEYRSIKMPVSIPKTRFTEINVDGDYLYVIIRATGQFIIWDNYKKDGNPQVLAVRDLCEEITNHSLGMITCVGSKIVFSVAYSDAIYCFDCIHHTCYTMQVPTKKFSYPLVYPNRCIQGEDGKTLYCMQTNENHWLEINMETEMVTIKPFDFKNAIHGMRKVLAKELEMKGYGEFDSSYLNLQQFINLLEQDNVRGKMGRDLGIKSTVGTQVWDAIVACMEEL